jgi:hypothetical protein
MQLGSSLVTLSLFMIGLVIGTGVVAILYFGPMERRRAARLDRVTTDRLKLWSLEKLVAEVCVGTPDELAFLSELIRQKNFSEFSARQRDFQVDYYRTHKSNSQWDGTSADFEKRVLAELARRANSGP